MTIGNIKHQIRITVDSDNPESRVIGIMKVAGLFEEAGIHLASNLSIHTAQLMAKVDPSAVGDVPNATIVATIGEVKMSVGEPGAWAHTEMGRRWQSSHDNTLTDVVRPQPFDPRSMAPLSPVYSDPRTDPRTMYQPPSPNGQRQDTQFKPVFMNPRQLAPVTVGQMADCNHHVNANKSTLDKIFGGRAYQPSAAVLNGQLVFPFQHSIDLHSPVTLEGKPIDRNSYVINPGLTSITLIKDELISLVQPCMVMCVGVSGDPYGSAPAQYPHPRYDGYVGDRVPGYEHNPMAQGEYFAGSNYKPSLVPTIAGQFGGRVLRNAWPFPLALGTVATSVVKSEGEPDQYGRYSHYVVMNNPPVSEIGIVLADITIDSVDSSKRNGVLLTDLLAICEDRLMCNQSGNAPLANHPDLDGALNSIRKALKHLHSLTIQGHLHTATTKVTDIENSDPVI